MSNEEKSPAHTYNKGRNVICDGQDRHALRDQLELCIDPLDPGQHPSGKLVNIVTGMVGTHASGGLVNIVTGMVGTHASGGLVNIVTGMVGTHASGGLVNIVTGMVGTHASVNVDDAVQLGHTQMESFKKAWPVCFHDTIHKVVNTLSFSRKHLTLQKAKVFDTETTKVSASLSHVVIVI